MSGISEVDQIRALFARCCGSLVPQKRRMERVNSAYGEFDQLCQEGYVANIAAGDTGVFVGTTLLVGDTGLNEIGEFLLTISQEEVTWENLTRQIVKWHAPYISYNNVACGLGSESVELQMHIKDGRLDRAFLLMITMARKTPGYYAPASINEWPPVMVEISTPVVSAEVEPEFEPRPEPELAPQQKQKLKGKLWRGIGRIRWLKK